MSYLKNTLKGFLFLVLMALMAVPPTPSRAQAGGQTNIRDTEIENSLKEWIAPLLQAAGMGPDSVHLILVQSNDVNAFVAGGANIFIYTGLIEKTEGPGEIIGVLGHELGHVAGGHLVGMNSALERASYESILGMVVGIGAAIATGSGEAANAIMTGSNSIATRRLLAHSRVNESSADQAALRFLESAQLNPTGFRTFMQKLGSEELLPISQQSEYVRTHPLSSDRIDALGTRIDQSPYKDVTLPAKWTEEHKRMKAKLLGFIEPGRVPWVYGDRDQSIPARYAYAIAAYRQNKIGDALERIDSLIAQEPHNPYFQELKGQMLVDFGKLQDALPYYKKAVEDAPNAGLIRIDYGHALLETGSTEQAIENLERALRDEPRSGTAHRLLATAYGRTGRENIAKLHLAEEAVLQRNLDYAKKQAETVLNTSEKGSREWVQARDIIDHIEILKNQEE
jgi:predicted Zn-dependent protease